MQTYNYTDISLGEYPGEISLILYSGSCTCRCPWCFNPSLLKRKPLTFKQMKDAIDEHIDFITAIVISGGEPLSNPYLKKIIQYAKSKGLKIKLNTNGLVSSDMQKNTFIPLIDYINISIKGLQSDYKAIVSKKIFSSIVPHCNILEYSFVYTPSLWPEIRLELFYEMLMDNISQKWDSLFTNKWTRPDIFTITQMETTDCLNKEYNNCRTPTRQECMSVAKIFKDIPKKKTIIETKEFGREII